MEDTFRVLGEDMRRLLSEQFMFIDDIHLFKSVQKRVLFHPRPDTLPVYKALYHLGFNNLCIINGPGASLWNELDSVCVRATNGNYELVKWGPMSREPHDPLLDPDPLLTLRDRRTLRDFCDRFDSWVTLVQAVVPDSQHASRFRTRIQKVRASVAEP